ncbi:alpha-galactosidase [Vibrio lamellibrachiae]|uniref:alpha-galactosidase n=1 Tax=Vibrio lamellibrachiae TaxID=2910253 RepID=UPI003D0E789D
MNEYFHLEGTQSSLVIAVGVDMPSIVYWGERLKYTSDLTTISSAHSKPIPQTSLDIDIPFGLSPEASKGYFGAPGLEGSRNGVNWSPQFQLSNIERVSNGITLTCIDEIASIELIIELLLDPTSDVLQTRTQIVNLSDQPYELQRLSNTLPLATHMMELMCFNGRWCKEFHTNRHLLDHGVFIQENRRGRTSHEHFPGLVIGAPGFSEEQGEVYGFHLAWSGNHRIRAEVTPEGGRYFQAEELLHSGEVTLTLGKSYQTPWLYATHSTSGLNGMSNQFHRFIRGSILNWPTKATVRPVHLNTWEGIYFDHNPDYLREMAKNAAKMGIERFIIDDGWFRGRNSDNAGLGDWFLDECKYPDGLNSVVNYVNMLGMEFGLWFEPEMVNPNSDLFRSHPEWVLGTPEYKQATERNQYVLNLQVSDCFDYILERLDEVLTRYNIRYIKWDMNRTLVQASHNGKPAIHGQTKAFYALVDAIRLRHPDVEIESCSSGGGRIDMEVLKRTHRFWVSDTNDPVERQMSQKGFSYFFPPEVMGAHIGTDISHTTGRRNSIAFRGITALFGHMGMELDPASASNSQKSDFSHFISIHKQFRKLVHSNDLVRFDYPDPTVNAYGVISIDKQEAIVSVAQIQSRSYTLPLPLRIPYLEPTQEYAIKLVEGENLMQSMKKSPSWVESGVNLTGEVLTKMGLQLPVLWPESALLLHIKAIES